MKRSIILLSYDLMAKFKTIMVRTRAAGTPLSRRIVMAIGSGVVKSNKCNIVIGK